MKPTVFSLVVLSLLSGCTLTNGEQYRKETQEAIQRSESNLGQQISNLNLAVSNQSDYIESLETEVISLKSEVNKLKKQSVKQSSILNSAVAGQETIAHEPVRNASSGQSENSSQLVILGAVESIKIGDIKQPFNARIDTGSETSSLNAVDVTEFEREGNKWVRFYLPDGSGDEQEENWVEAPIIKYVNIRQVGVENVIKRPVIEMWVKIGKIQEKSQFTLADRSQMSHSILLGREFIRDIAVVDVSRNHLLSEANNKNQS